MFLLGELAYELLPSNNSSIQQVDELLKNL